MARKTANKSFADKDILCKISKENAYLVSEFLEYLKATSKSEQTIYSYKSDLDLFNCWNIENNDGKFFVDFTKRDIMKYQNYLVNELELSPNRVRRLKATLSSMSNFIESMMDDIYKDFKPIINKIPSPPKQDIREKTVLEDDDIDKLLGILVENKQYQKACALSLAAASGARKSELLRFKKEYFVEENIIYGALYKTPEKIKTKGRGRGKFLIKFVLVAKFKPYLDLWMKQREELGVDCEELFVSKRNGKWEDAKISTLDSFGESFGKILEKDFYWHSLRHYFCTSLCKCNIPQSVIKDIIGWDSVVMIDTYNDTEIDDELGKYFDESGIITSKKNGIESL